MGILGYQLQIILEAFSGVLLVAYSFWYILLIIFATYIISLRLHGTAKDIIVFCIPFLVFLSALFGFIVYFINPHQDEASIWLFAMLLGTVTIGFVLTIFSIAILHKFTLRVLIVVLGIFIVFNLTLASITYHPAPDFSRPYCGAKECSALK